MRCWRFLALYNDDKFKCRVRSKLKNRMQHCSLRRAVTLTILTVVLGAAVGCEHLSGGSALTTSQRLADQAVAPAYQRWVAQSQALFEQAQSVCLQPDAASIERLRAAWRQDALAWSALQSMQPGPVTPISVRVSYWPDKKDLVGHQVEQWLQQPLPTAAQLAEQSVTLQGLSALEFLLFDARFDWSQAPQRERLCPPVSVIAERQHRLAKEALQSWEREQGMGMRSALPNSRYASESEALAELLKANVAGLEVAHKKLVAALGDKYPQPFLAEYWRSDLSLPSARAVLEGSRSLWQSGLADAVAKQQPSLAAQIDEAYMQLLASPLLSASLQNATLQSADASALTLRALLKSAEGRAQLKDLAEQMKLLHLQYAREVSKALQIPLGINAHDGD